MDNYYTQVLEEIEEALKENPLLAYAKCVEELKMPYIPMDIEEKLKEYYKEASALINLDKGVKSLTIQQIQKDLKASEEQQIRAISQLLTMNLRDHMPMIEDYLVKGTSDVGMGLLIDGLIEQEINEELVCEKDGLRYEFNPRYSEPPYETDGYKYANKYLIDWFESDEPSLYELMHQLLIKTVYCYLPLTYEEEDAGMLALSIARKACILRGEEETFIDFCKEKGFESLKLLDIEA